MNRAGPRASQPGAGVVASQWLILRPSKQAPGTRRRRGVGGRGLAKGAGRTTLKREMTLDFKG